MVEHEPQNYSTRSWLSALPYGATVNVSSSSREGHGMSNKDLILEHAFEGLRERLLLGRHGGQEKREIKRRNASANRNKQRRMSSGRAPSRDPPHRGPISLAIEHLAKKVSGQRAAHQFRADPT